MPEHPTASPSTREGNPLRRFLRALGPAIIVACVVLGPGSILTASKVGCQYGYTLIWVPVMAGLLMVGVVALAARLGVSCEQTLCSELAAGVGRPIAFLAGVSVFLIATCFQFSNNLGVMAAIEPLFPDVRAWVVLVAGNVVVIAALLGFKRLYVPLEKLMMVFVGIMLVAFAANLCFAGPGLLEILQGLIPSLPDALTASLVPTVVESEIDGTKSVRDTWLPVTGLIATTFSVAGGFYQAYLVREKGWNESHLRQGLVDALAGITVLMLITMMILVTAAAVLHGRIEVAELKSLGDVAVQLEPLFGENAKMLFCLGIFAGAVSSFLVNSIIGGTMLADGLGLDCRIDSKWTKAFTVVVLLTGMIVALSTTRDDRVPLIVFAQATTVLGVPLLAASLLYLTTRSTIRTPTWIMTLVSAGLLVTLALAARKAWSIVLGFTL